MQIIEAAQPALSPVLDFTARCTVCGNEFDVDDLSECFTCEAMFCTKCNPNCPCCEA